MHRVDVVGGAHALEVRLRRDQRDQQVAQVRVVLGDQHAKRVGIHDAPEITCASRGARIVAAARRSIQSEGRQMGTGVPAGGSASVPGVAQRADLSPGIEQQLLPAFARAASR